MRVARAAVRRHAAYRVATVASVVENSVASMVRAFVLLAVVRTTGTVDGLDAREAASFAFLAGAIEAGVRIVWPLDVDERIKTGDVIIDLQRPVDLQLWWLAHEAGRSVYMVATRGIPPYVFGMLVLHIVAPASMRALALFAISLMLSFTVAFAWRFLVSLSGFWVLDTRGTNSLAGLIVTACSGALLPLQLWPDVIADVLRLLPFAAIIQTPFEVFTGRPVGAAMALQVLWAAALLLLGRAVLGRAVAKVVIQGG